MRRVKFFFQVLVKSLTDFGYYREIAKAKFWFSFKYLYFLLFLTSLFWGIFFATKALSFVPQAPKIVANAKTTVLGLYPKELVVTLKSGKLSTNVKEPYYLDFPGLPTHLIAIDTKAKESDFVKYKSVLLLTRESMVAMDGETSYKVFPLSEAKTDLLVNKALYDELAKKILPYFDYFPYVLYALAAVSIVILPFVSASFSLAGKLFLILITSLLLFFLAKIMKKNLSYGKIYQLSLHALTLPILLGLVARLANFPLPGFVSALILLVFMGIVIKKY